MINCFYRIILQNLAVAQPVKNFPVFRKKETWNLREVEVRTSLDTQLYKMAPDV
jgi:hypothetical protein